MKSKVKSKVTESFETYALLWIWPFTGYLGIQTIPTGRDCATFRDSGTGKTFLSRDKGTTGQKFLHCPGTKGQRDKLKILPRDGTGFWQAVPSQDVPRDRSERKIVKKGDFYYFFSWLFEIATTTLICDGFQIGFQNGFQNGFLNGFPNGFQNRCQNEFQKSCPWKP